MVTKGAHYRQVIMQSLRISEEQYGNLFLDEGARYLHLYMERDVVATAILQQCPAYWQWWSRQWDLRTYRFVQAHELETYGRSLPPNLRMELQQEWYAGNNAEQLTIRLPRRVAVQTGDIIRNAMLSCKQ